MSNLEASRPGEPVSSNLAELFSSLGIAGPLPYLPDEEAPPIDEYLLTALAKGELGEEDADVVWRYIASFRSWEAAHRVIGSNIEAGVVRVRETINDVVADRQGQRRDAATNQE